MPDPFRLRCRAIVHQTKRVNDSAEFEAWGECCPVRLAVQKCGTLAPTRVRGHFGYGGIL
eukprot:383289-Rhodomonas_salina.1